MVEHIVSVLLSPSVSALLFCFCGIRQGEKRRGAEQTRYFIATEVRSKWAVQCTMLPVGLVDVCSMKLQPSRRPLLGQCLLCPVPLIPHSDSEAPEGCITPPTVRWATTVLGRLELARATDRSLPGCKYWLCNALVPKCALMYWGCEQNDKLFSVTRNRSQDITGDDD